jgi:hypothetical protein
MGTETAMRAGQRLAVEGAKIGTKNLSNKASMIVQGTSLGVQAAGTVAQAGMTYDYQTTLADAKEQQAKAKLEKAISDMLQNQFQALSTTLQGMLEMRNTAVNQMIAMLKNQFGVMQKAVSQISA